MKLPGLMHYAWIGLFVAVLDQGSKEYVEQVLLYRERVDVTTFFAWVHLQNTGAAFSFLASGSGWQRWLLSLLAVGFSVWILRELAQLQARERLTALALGLILGGAIGNLVDRLEHGAVTDFILFHWFDAWYFPAFNVADMAISCGAALWIWVLLFASPAPGGEGASGARSTDG